VDLTLRGVTLAHERSVIESLRPRLAQADSECLPFANETFDVVYSFGVIHHSPDTRAAAREIHRVLRPGGTAKVMIYHSPSVTGILLWIVHALLKGRPWRSPRWVIARYLESPGTKVYSRREARELFSAFSSVEFDTVLGSGDLLLMRPSRRYANPLARLAWRMYPRWFVRTFCSRLGLTLLITAKK
jgi:SAM-dependent methyltransferase